MDKMDNKILAIQNLHESDSVKLSLVQRGYDSSVKIYEQPMGEFINRVSDLMPPEEAKRAYLTAQRNYLVLTNMVVALNATYGSPAYKALSSRAFGAKDGAYFENMPNYQQIFGNLDYCKCPHCKSIFGPAAYYVDLMRLIKKHVRLDTAAQSPLCAIPIRQRRPDLFGLKLNCENTNTTKPYLEIVNSVVESHAQSWLKSKDIYKELARRNYPDSLPFRLPAARLKTWLDTKQVALSDILCTFGQKKKIIAAEDMNIGTDTFDLLKRPISASLLHQFYGMEKLDLKKLESLPAFLAATGLTQQELSDILVQDTGGSEELLQNLFINQGPAQKGSCLRINGDRLENLTADSLERFTRFTRLKKLLHISCEELDWLIKAAGCDAKGNIPLQRLWGFVNLAKKLSVDIYTATALFVNIKSYGDDPFAKLFHYGRKELEDAGDIDYIERVLAGALSISIEDLRGLRAYLGQGDTVQIDQIYRHCALASLMKMRMREYILLLKLLFSRTVKRFRPHHIETLYNAYLTSALNVYELDYVVNATPSAYISTRFTMEAFCQKALFIRTTISAEYKADKELLANYVYLEMADFLGCSPKELGDILACFMSDAAIGDWLEKLAGDTKPEELGGIMLLASRYLLLVQKGVDVGLLRQAAAHGRLFGIKSVLSPTARNVLDLFLYQAYLPLFGDTDKKLIRFIEEYAGNKNDFTTLSAVTGWDKKQIADILGTMTNRERVKANIGRLIRVVSDCVLLLGNLNLDCDALGLILSAAGAPAEQYDKAAKAVGQLCAPYMNEDINARVEAAKRDALLPVTLLKLREQYCDINDYNKLYKYFLIDVEMDDKTRISPVKEGINALQLYLQRCRMQLEKGVIEVTIPESWWAWIMDYRMWEANRKLFVYPENYLLPSLRKSKTSLYKNVEDALQQSRLTDAYIEREYVKYLDDYLELTQLKICGAYETVIDNINVFYLFARAQKKPYTYYYCKRVSTLAWSEWQKIDTNIDADTITPVFVFNRLHIFWSKVNENAKIKVESGEQLNAGNQNSHSLQIQYTYLNLQGEWILPQTLSDGVVIYAEDDRKSWEELQKKSDLFGMSVKDNVFDKITLLRLTQKNVKASFKKEDEFECLAVIVGPYTQNIGSPLKVLDTDSTFDKEQELFSGTINRLIQQSNFEVHNFEEGYFSTGYLKIFNEDLEEVHFIHKNEFIVVDGYVPPNRLLMYTVIHDEIHRAVGAYLSQSVLRDATLPPKGILPFENNTKTPQAPRLDAKSFIVLDSQNKTVISQDLSAAIFDKLTTEGILKKGIADERALANRDLSSLLNNLLIDKFGSAEKSNQILEIERILLKNVGAVYLFKNVDNARVIPVTNQPGKFIYDCGDETFLIYPVYADNGKYNPVNLQKTDAGVTVGVPVVKNTFMKLGFERLVADRIFDALTQNNWLDGNGILNTEIASRAGLEKILTTIITGTAEEKKDKLNLIYVKLLNLPVIAKKDLDRIAGVDSTAICKNLVANNVVYKWPGDAEYYRIDLSMLKTQNGLTFANTEGGLLGDSSVREIYRRLCDSVSSVNFNYHVNGDLPKPVRDAKFSTWKFAVMRLTNPTIKKLKRKLETGGISSFLNRKTQEPPLVPLMPFERLGPTDNIIRPKASDGAQIDFEGLYAEYNWELFYHIPLTIAQCFKANAMHEDSLRWFHYVFNPTNPPSETVDKNYWNFLPFTQSDAQTLEQILRDPQAIQAYNDSPFDPHAIARLRINAYGKYTVMAYVSNIINWGDSQFVLNTWESLTRATMMYVWASDLLGPRPQEVGTVKAAPDRSFDEIEKFYQTSEIPQFIIDLEKKSQELLASHDILPINEEVPYNDIRAYFGAPENSEILQMWDIIEDRLYKIRNSLDINGAPRSMLLFEAPVDPMAVARVAAASGAASPAALSAKAALYPYRFTYIVEQAKDLAAQLIQFGQSLLAAQEKQDAEALLLIVKAQEQSLLDMAMSIKENQILEISESIEALKISKAAAELKRDYYSKNADEYMSAKEIASFATSTAAAAFQAYSGVISFASSIAHLTPQVGSPFAMTYGGAEIGAALKCASTGYKTLAGVLAHASQQTLTMAQYDRRKQEWEMQKAQAIKEAEGLEKQLAAASIRMKMAKSDLELHRKSIENSSEVLRLLRGKFSSSQLYQWLVSRLGSTMWQTYQLALELALAAQEAYRCERGESDTFIKFDYWDSAHKGLMSGEGLLLALQQMQQRYHKKNYRGLEIEKNISLRSTCPEALTALKNTGECQFELSEKLFARDYPGCYCRKIKSISISIPAVLPPYETVKATLKQISSYILLRADKKGIDFLFGASPEPPGEDTVREATRRGEKIAVSRGIDDSGMFTLNFNDERYLPFEATGVSSKWYLEMPKSCNAFSFDTITDIIVNVKYTALEDERRGKDSFYAYVTAGLSK